MKDYDVQELVRDYRSLLKEFAPEIASKPFGTKKPLDKMAEYVRWCGARDIHPRLFMRFRFEKAMERQGLPPGLSSLASDDLGTEYTRTEAGAGISAYETSAKPVYDLVGRQNAVLYTVVRDAMHMPTPIEEQMRKRFADEGRPWMCRIEKHRSGMGFDPRSSTCRACPECERCLADVQRDEGFDIAALRRGDFEKLPLVVRTIALSLVELHPLVLPAPPKRSAKIG